MKMQLPILASILFLLTLGSCRKKELSSYVNQNQIYQDLSLSYHDASNSTTATARFYNGGSSGSRLELSQNSKVYYAGFELKNNGKRGTIYSVNLSNYQSGFNFDWNDTEGKHFINQAEIPAPIYSSNQSISSWSGPIWGYNLYFDGDSIAPDEEVHLTIEVDQDTSFSINIYESTPGRTYIHIPAWEVEKIMGFNASYYLKREKYKLLNDATGAGGMLTTSYYSTRSWVYVW